MKVRVDISVKQIPRKSPPALNRLGFISKRILNFTSASIQTGWSNRCNVINASCGGLPHCYSLMNWSFGKVSSYSPNSSKGMQHYPQACNIWYRLASLSAEMHFCLQRGNEFFIPPSLLHRIWSGSECFWFAFGCTVIHKGASNPHKRKLVGSKLQC